MHDGLMSTEELAKKYKPGTAWIAHLPEVGAITSAIREECEMLAEVAEMKARIAKVKANIKRHQAESERRVLVHYTPTDVAEAQAQARARGDHETANEIHRDQVGY